MFDKWMDSFARWASTEQLILSCVAAGITALGVVALGLWLRSLLRLCWHGLGVLLRGYPPQSPGVSPAQLGHDWRVEQKAVFAEQQQYQAALCEEPKVDHSEPLQSTKDAIRATLETSRLMLLEAVLDLTIARVDRLEAKIGVSLTDQVFADNAKRTDIKFGDEQAAP